MSLLPLSTTGSIPGVIKDHSSRNPDFVHFLMDETDFKDTFKETLQFINQNLKRKEGIMNSCQLWLHQEKVEEWKKDLILGLRN